MNAIIEISIFSLHTINLSLVNARISTGIKQCAVTYILLAHWNTVVLCVQTFQTFDAHNDAHSILCTYICDIHQMDEILSRAIWSMLIACISVWTFHWKSNTGWIVESYVSQCRNSLVKPLHHSGLDHLISHNIFRTSPKKNVSKITYSSSPTNRRDNFSVFLLIWYALTEYFWVCVRTISLNCVNKFHFLLFFAFVFFKI